LYTQNNGSDSTLVVKHSCDGTRQHNHHVSFYFDVFMLCNAIAFLHLLSNDIEMERYVTIVLNCTITNVGSKTTFCHLLPTGGCSSCLAITLQMMSYCFAATYGRKLINFNCDRDVCLPTLFIRNTLFNKGRILRNLERKKSSFLIHIRWKIEAS
jgi:hypothetical protein